MTVDIAELIRTIQTKVIPELPDEYKPNELNKKYSKDIVELFKITDYDARAERLIALSKEQKECSSQLHILFDYMASVDTKQFSDETLLQFIRFRDGVRAATEKSLLQVAILHAILKEFYLD